MNHMWYDENYTLEGNDITIYRDIKDDIGEHDNTI